MKHYLVVTGDEGGAHERTPYTSFEEAKEHYERSKTDEFHAALIEIDESTNEERTLMSITDGVEG